MKIKSRFMKITVASGLIVMSGAAVLGITGIASAQVGQNDAVVAVADAPVSGVSSSSRADRPSPLATAAQALNITEAELKAELVAGKSVADVAKEKNVDIDTVIAALTTKAKTHLAEEVAAGKHTQAEADAKLAGFTERVTTMVNTAGLPQGKGGHEGKGGREGKGGHRGKFVTEALATTLKMTEAELKTELQSGKSLSAIAETQNVDIADVKVALTTGFKTHLAEEVASGKHTQAEADAKLAEFTDRLDDMVNKVRPAGGPEGHRKGGHGHGPMGGAPASQGTSATA